MVSASTSPARRQPWQPAADRRQRARHPSRTDLPAPIAAACHPTRAAGRRTPTTHTDSTRATTSTTTTTLPVEADPPQPARDARHPRAPRRGAVRVVHRTHRARHTDRRHTTTRHDEHTATTSTTDDTASSTTIAITAIGIIATTTIAAIASTITSTPRGKVTDRGDQRRHTDHHDHERRRDTLSTPTTIERDHHARRRPPGQGSRPAPRRSTAGGATPHHTPAHPSPACRSDRLCRTRHRYPHGYTADAASPATTSTAPGSTPRQARRGQHTGEGYHHKTGHTGQHADGRAHKEAT